MWYVLYKNAGVLSGRALKVALGKLHKGAVIGGYPSKFDALCRKHGQPTAVINLGVTDNVGYTGPVLNSPDMVRAGSNKRKARQVFAQAKIPAPKLFLNSNEVTAADLPVVGRTSYHRKGEGFWFCNTLAEVHRAVKQGATHFLEFVPSTHEYRVHTFIKGKHLARPRDKREPGSYVSTKISEKIWVGQGKPDPREPQKNHEFGWSFLGPQNRREEELDVVRHAAKQAIAALGMDFGAVDVMYNLRNKFPYVLEVNSTPSLADEQATTCDVYAARIVKTLGGEDE